MIRSGLQTSARAARALDTYARTGSAVGRKHTPVRWKYNLRTPRQGPRVSRNTLATFACNHDCARATPRAPLHAWPLTRTIARACCAAAG
eukprot:11790012-Alexandrium_andersonii.AAC.1